MEVFHTFISETQRLTRNDAGAASRGGLAQVLTENLHLAAHPAPVGALPPDVRVTAYGFPPPGEAPPVVIRHIEPVGASEVVAVALEAMAEIVRPGKADGAVVVVETVDTSPGDLISDLTLWLQPRGLVCSASHISFVVGATEVILALVPIDRLIARLAFLGGTEIEPEVGIAGRSSRTGIR